MCICINCHHIFICETYRFIEQQHSHNTGNHKNHNFNPVKTIINVNINKTSSNVIFDWDVKECSSFVEEPGYWISNI
uniref:Uncharacterized protein n=1 Tax=Polysiphonia urceolata TaxID=173545 RepID=A0A1Z1MCL0_POLUR|nr:hypothetical protein [Polysiphonia stricta]ARW63494.1 hypothetical protein [Polysiphonia stricta]